MLDDLSEYKYFDDIIFDIKRILENEKKRAIITFLEALKVLNYDFIREQDKFIPLYADPEWSFLYCHTCDNLNIPKDHNQIRGNRFLGIDDTSMLFYCPNCHDMEEMGTDFFPSNNIIPIQLCSDCIATKVRIDKYKHYGSGLPDGRYIDYFIYVGIDENQAWVKFLKDKVKTAVDTDFLFKIKTKDEGLTNIIRKITTGHYNPKIKE